MCSNRYGLLDLRGRGIRADVQDLVVACGVDVIAEAAGDRERSRADDRETRSEAEREARPARSMAGKHSSSRMLRQWTLNWKLGIR